MAPLIHRRQPPPAFERQDRGRAEPARFTELRHACGLAPCPSIVLAEEDVAHRLGRLSDRHHFECAASFAYDLLAPAYIESSECQGVTRAAHNSAERSQMEHAD